jgi:hypothetical protein
MAAAALMLSIAAVSFFAGLAIFFGGGAAVPWSLGAAALMAFGLLFVFLGAMNVVDAVIWLRGCNLPRTWWYRSWESFNGTRRKGR